MKQIRTGLLIIFITMLLAGLKLVELSIAADLASKTMGHSTYWSDEYLYYYSIIAIIISLLSLIGYIVMLFIKEKEVKQ